MDMGMEKMVATGLSPRVRGNRYHRARDHAARRSIPACAGEPAAESVDQARQRVYPRVCGGTLPLALALLLILGLSPRVRGNRYPPHYPRRRHRSIPACAGEPIRHAIRPPAGGVYPRVCGGTWGCRPRYPAPVGLSPRVRGNLLTP